MRKRETENQYKNRKRNWDEIEGKEMKLKAKECLHLRRCGENSGR